MDIKQATSRNVSSARFYSIGHRFKVVLRVKEDFGYDKHEG